MKKEKRYRCELDYMDGYIPEFARTYIYATSIEGAIGKLKKLYDVIEITSVSLNEKTRITMDNI